MGACVPSDWVTPATYAQQPTVPRHIGVVSPGFSPDSDEWQAFREGLRAAGYVEGRDVSIDWWYGHGNYRGAEDAVARAVRDKVDVIVVESTISALAAKRATQTIPIVMALVGDPVGVGLVQSLAQPGGNVTGLTNMTAELMAKRLQLLTEAVPSARRVGVLWNPDTPVHKIGLAHLTSAAPQLNVELVPVGVHKAEEFGPAFSLFSRSKVAAVMALGDPFMVNNGATVVQLATRARLPMAFDNFNRPLAEQGILISYGPRLVDLFRRAAVYCAKILQGASPAALPVEQPTKFYLVVNMKAAKVLGLTIPESVLLQADEVIR
jgi:putative ABC transport system substrate-binding protein